MLKISIAAQALEQFIQSQKLSELDVSLLQTWFEGRIRQIWEEYPGFMPKCMKSCFHGALATLRRMNRDDDSALHIQPSKYETMEMYYRRLEPLCVPQNRYEAVILQKGISQCVRSDLMDVLEDSDRVALWFRRVVAQDRSPASGSKMAPVLSLAEFRVEKPKELHIPARPRGHIHLNPETRVFEGILESDLQFWESSYPAISVEAQLASALKWLLEHSTIPNSVVLFLDKWMFRSDFKARTGSFPSSYQTSYCRVARPKVKKVKSTDQNKGEI